MSTSKVQDPVLFLRCLSEAAANTELVAEFDRLTGYNVALRGPAIVQEIDKSTGFLEQGARAFYDFVVDVIYLPLQRDLNGLKG